MEETSRIQGRMGASSEGGCMEWNMEYGDIYMSSSLDNLLASLRQFV